jgi:hypothetical protein
MATLYTFQNIMIAIASSSVTSTSNTSVYITRQTYANLVANSSGQLPFLVLPIISVNTIDFAFNLYNYASCSFPFVATDFTTATDWLVYTLPS